MGPWLESLVPWGADFIVWVQSLSTPWLDTLFEILTFLGKTWCRGDRPQWPDEKVIALVKDLTGKGGVEALAEVLDAVLCFLVFLFAGLEGFVQGGDLAAQREELLVEKVDLCECLGGDFLLVVEFARQT